MGKWPANRPYDYGGDGLFFGLACVSWRSLYLLRLGLIVKHQIRTARGLSQLLVVSVLKKSLFLD